MKYIVLGIISIVIIIAASCNSRKESVTSHYEEEVNLQGDFKGFMTAKSNYQNYCAGCHGAEMKAFVDRSWINGDSKEDIMNSIKNGIEKAGMPAYDTTFTASELEELTEFILKGIKETGAFETTSVVTPTFYKTEHLDVKIDTVVSDIEIPWGMKVAKDGTLFFTERMGTLKVRKPDGSVMTIENTPVVNNRGQGGMLDIALHPNYEENQFVYLSYSKINKENDQLSTTAVVRGKLVGNLFTESKEVFEMLPYSDTNHHYGSRLVFDNEGYLFISVGERGNRDENPQSLSRHAGKIHRIYDDGRIPEDNPFFNTEDAVKSIWTYGNRNPQGMVFNELTSEILEHEHGPRGGDELNIIKKGMNYGWPIVSYGINYNGTSFTNEVDREEFESPLNIWIPSIAPCGMTVVNSDKYAEWNGDILIGSLRYNYISRVRIEGGKVVEEERIFKDIGRIRAIEMGQDGYLYIAVEGPGMIYKVSVVEDMPAIENKDVDFSVVKIKEVRGMMSPESIAYDKATDALYVSQLPADRNDSEGKGKIAKLSPEGDILDLDFIVGLNRPLGVAIVGDKLYTADGNVLVEIDLTTQEIIKRHEGKNAVFLNDVAASKTGDIYVSDMMKSSIYKLSDGVFTEWYSSVELDAPNGLLIEGESMYISSWGIDNGHPGTLLKLDMNSKEIEPVLPYKLGNMDGLQRYDATNYIVSDWNGGAIYSVSTTDEHPTKIINTEYSVGDILFTPENNYLYLPLNYQQKIVIYQFSIK